MMIAVIVLAFGLAQTNPGHAILRKTGLFEEPASYTSLAFLHPQHLPPEQLKSKQVTVGVSFVIHNTGGVGHDYQWSVSLIQGERIRRAVAGSIRIAPGRGITITRAVRISCVSGKVKIVVNLARPAEFIDAWATCWAPRK